MNNRPYTIERYKNRKGIEHLCLVAGNGEIVMGSENFSAPSNCLRAANRIIEAGKRGFVLGEKKIAEQPAKAKKAKG